MPRVGSAESGNRLETKRTFMDAPPRDRMTDQGYWDEALPAAGRDQPLRAAVRVGEQAGRLGDHREPEHAGREPAVGGFDPRMFSAPERDDFLGRAVGIAMRA